MKFKTILYKKKENVGWVTLNRPKVMNSANDTMRTELKTLLKKIKEEEDIHIIVFTGSGKKAFSAGDDINEFPDWNMLDIIKEYKGEKQIFQIIREIPKPVIAMVNGYALGGGCELALACDIIIAADNAKFGLPEISVGLIPGGGGTQLLPRLVGEKKAKELIFTGDIITAERALELGLVNQVVPKESLREEVKKFIFKLKKRSPAILKLAKLAVNKSLDTTLTAGMDSEIDFFAMCFETEDQKEGAKAFIEKRKPVYKGR